MPAKNAETAVAENSSENARMPFKAAVIKAELGRRQFGKVLATGKRDHRLEGKLARGHKMRMFTPAYRDLNLVTFPKNLCFYFWLIPKVD